MVCVVCGKTFLEDWRKYKTASDPKYCSRVCSNHRVFTEEIKNKISLKLSKEKRRCLCGKELERHNTSGKCSPCFIRDRKERLAFERSKNQEVKKDGIKKQLHDLKLKVFEDWKNNITSEAIETQSGLTKKELGSFYKRAIKDFLLELQDNRCSICGINNIWNGDLITFILDHIDGDSYNHKRNNLRLICPNCDSQQPTFKSRNKGKGRVARRIKYHERYTNAIQLGLEKPINL